MNDVVDIAQAQNELILAGQIRRVTSRVGGVSKTHCIDCDSPIPKIRQETVKGCVRCVACQSEFEEYQTKHGQTKHNQGKRR